LIAEIILLIIFIIFFIIGFFIIYKQVALVKKGEFNIKDRLQCLIYGFIFSLAVSVVMAMAFIFTVENPEFWQGTSIVPEKVNSLALLLPFTLSLGYISFYPLIDFIFIALSPETDEGLTPFHKFIGHNLINRTSNKYLSVFMALLLYLLFIIPPILFSFIGVPFLLMWISWMLIYPLMILTFYGSKGYIAGITNEYYHIPDLKKSLFLGFEDSKRSFTQFITNPKPFIVLGLMIFVFVWAWISMIQTIIFFFSGTFAISTMTSYFVFVTLLFGIIGYFTRFWGRKIKYRGIDIYFAAYLMATIGINVLVNFLIVNADKLTYTFNSWPLTYNLTSNYTLFAWPAVIEEVFLIIFTSYYFLSRKSDFTRNLKHSKITQYGQEFDPIPLFNLLLNRDPNIQNHAKDTLMMMYERIPKKADLSINDWKFKDLLIDGLCSSNPNLQSICYKILKQLLEDAPKVIFPWIENALKSPNYDKTYPILKLLNEADISFLEKFSTKHIINLIEDPEWKIRLYSLKIISKLIKKNENLIQKLNITNLLEDPNNQIQVELLNALSYTSFKISPKLFFENLNNINKEVRAATIRNIKNVNLDKLDSKFIEKIVPLMRAPANSVRGSIFEALSKIGHFKKFSIPIDPLIEGLNDLNDDVRNSASKAIETCFNESPNIINLNEIIGKIDSNDLDSTITILSLLGKLWNKDPEIILTTLLIYIKFDDSKLKETISEIIINKYDSDSDFIFNKLIETKDDIKFVSKGIVSKTLIKLGIKFPDKIIPKLINSLGSPNNEIILNSIVSLDGLVEKYTQKIDLKPVISILNQPIDLNVKKEVSQLVAKASKVAPQMVKPVIPDLINSLYNQDTPVVNILLKSILELVKSEPGLIQAKSITALLDNKDSFLRETVVKILGYIGNQDNTFIANLLINKALNDDDWIVRNAAILSLGNILKFIDNQESLIEDLIPLLDDKNSWVQKSTMNLFSTLTDIKPSQIPLEKISKNITSQDSKIREGCAQLLRIHIEKDTEKTFDSFIILLGDEIKDVRTTTIDVVVEIIQKVGISKVFSKLLKNLSDEVSIKTQQSIAIILGRTLRYGDDSIKKRAISLLKIRCEVSQDPIICENLTKLRES
jgi:HEAT repeat protein/MFS family permease